MEEAANSGITIYFQTDHTECLFPGNWSKTAKLALETCTTKHVRPYYWKNPLDNKQMTETQL